MRSLACRAQPLDLVEGGAFLRGGPSDLEDREVAGDAATLLELVRRSAPDVVGDQYGAAVDPLRLQLVLGGVEVEHVTGVVAVAEQHPPALVGGLGDGVRPLGGRGGEQVAHGRAVREAGADEAGEGRVVPGSATDDDRHRGLGRPRGADHAARHGPHPAARGGDEAVHQLVQEIGRVVEQPRHCDLLVVSSRPVTGASRPGLPASFTPAPAQRRPRAVRPRPSADRGLLVRPLVLADGRDLLGRRRVRVEPVAHPLPRQPARDLEPDHPLAHAEHLGVVAQHRALDGEAVVRRDRADPRDLVRADRHAQAGPAHEQCAIGLAVHDQPGRRHRDVRVVRVFVDVAPDIDDLRRRGRRCAAGRQVRPCTESPRSRSRPRCAACLPWGHSSSSMTDGCRGPQRDTAGAPSCISDVT